MKKKEIFLTDEGYKELKEELKSLTIEKRAEVVQALKEARALGDLSENSEYDAARDAQRALEDRIKEIEYTLEHAKIIKPSKNADTVTIGCTVTIAYDDDEDDTEVYKIVGAQEANPFNNMISNESPIAAAILNKKVGSIVDVDSPNGKFSIKILNVA